MASDSDLDTKTLSTLVRFPVLHATSVGISAGSAITRSKRTVSPMSTSRCVEIEQSMVSGLVPHWVVTVEVSYPDELRLPRCCSISSLQRTKCCCSIFSLHRMKRCVHRFQRSIVIAIIVNIKNTYPLRFRTDLDGGHIRGVHRDGRPRVR